MANIQIENLLRRKKTIKNKQTETKKLPASDGRGKRCPSPHDATQIFPGHASFFQLGDCHLSNSLRAENIASMQVINIHEVARGRIFEKEVAISWEWKKGGICMKSFVDDFWSQDRRDARHFAWIAELFIMKLLG